MPTVKELREELDAQGIEYPPTANKAGLEALLAAEEPVQEAPEPTAEPEETVSVSREDWDRLQEDLKMLKATADKGRVFHYQNQQAQQGKQAKRVSIAIHDGKYLVGWRTLKDTIVKHPTTGAPVGEEQLYEILLDNNGAIETAQVNGYPRFTEIRYSDRVQCNVVGESTDYEGNVSFDVELPGGRVIKLAGQFVN